MDDSISTTDIAARFGVSVAAVSQWRTRHGQGTENPFPQPDRDGRQPRWLTARWAEIEAWRLQQGSGRRGPKNGSKVSRAPRKREGYLSALDVAQLLQVSKSAVRTWLSSGLEPAFPEPDDTETPSDSSRKFRWWRDSRRDELVAWYAQYLGQQADDVLHRRRATRTSRKPGNSKEIAALDAIAHQFFGANAFAALQALAILHLSGATDELDDNLRQVAHEAAEVAQVVTTLQLDRDGGTSDRISELVHDVARSRHTRENAQLNQVAYLLSQMSPSDFLLRLSQSSKDVGTTSPQEE